MAKAWSEVSSDPDFLGLPQSEQAKVQQAYFANVVIRDSDFKALPLEEKQKLASDFFGKQPLAERILATTGEVAGKIAGLGRRVAEPVEKLPTTPFTMPLKATTALFVPQTEEQVYGQALGLIAAPPVARGVTKAMGAMRRVPPAIVTKPPIPEVPIKPPAIPLIPKEPTVEDPVKIITEAIRGAKPLLGKQAQLYHEALSQKAAKIARAGEAVPGEAGLFAQLKAATGLLPKVQFEGIRSSLSGGNIDKLFDMIEKHPTFEPFEKLNAKIGLENLLGTKGSSLPIKSQLELLSQVFPQEFVNTILQKRPVMVKFWETTGKTINAQKAFMATGDLSAPLRQGAFLVGRVRQFIPAFRDMFKYAWDEKAYQGLNKEIRARPTYKAMKSGKLALTDLGESMTSREEVIMSNLPEKIPVFGRVARASNRAYAGFLNKLRADVFDELYKGATEGGALARNPAIVEDIGKFVNAATGRGDIGDLGRIAPILNAFLFSPRLVASRVNLLNPNFYIKLDPFVRKEALKDLMRFSGTALTALGLAKLGGAEVGIDPRSADFGKIKIGKTRYDPWGGFQQYFVLGARLVTGKMMSSTTGREYTLGEGYRPVTRWDILGRFFQSKESPIAGLVTMLMQGQTFTGEKIDIPSEVLSRFIPMFTQDIYDLYKEKGVAGIPQAIPAGFGVGIQTYGPQMPRIETTPTGRPAIRWGQEPGLAEAMVNIIRKTPVTGVPPQYIPQLQKEREEETKQQIAIDAAKKRVLSTGKSEVVGNKLLYLDPSGVVITRTFGKSPIGVTEKRVLAEETARRIRERRGE